MKAVALTNLIFAVLADVVILSAMYYWLRLRHHPKLLMYVSVVYHAEMPSYVRAAAQRNHLNGRWSCSILQLAHICIFVALPSRQFWIAFQMTGCKFYVNSVLALYVPRLLLYQLL
ncbi:hypothetical protein ID866_3125 [Astraeus odoratus]|nr:hypothetical protein ID866_3125 [Astraeus odoratus]